MNMPMVKCLSKRNKSHLLGVSIQWKIKHKMTSIEKCKLYKDLVLVNS